MAYAGALFADSCLRGLNGDSNVFDYSYVESDVTDVPFFSSRVDLGPDGTHTLAHPVCVHDCAVGHWIVHFEPCSRTRTGLQPNFLYQKADPVSLCQQQSELRASDALVCVNGVLDCATLTQIMRHKQPLSL